jgi:hypothetical protein
MIELAEQIPTHCSTAIMWMPPGFSHAIRSPLLPFTNNVDTGWPHNRPGYLVWFEPNEFKHYLPPEEIGKFADWN